MKKRVVSLLLCFALMLGLIVYNPPRADAFVVSGPAIGVIAAAVAVASGINFLHSGMDETALADYFAGQIENYCSSIGETVSDWWDGLGEDLVTVDANNRLILGAPAYAAVQSAVGWWRDQNGVNEGVSAVPVSSGITLPLTSPADTSIKIGAYNAALLPGNSTKFYPKNFTTSKTDNLYELSSAFKVQFRVNSNGGTSFSIRYFQPDSNVTTTASSSFSGLNNDASCFYLLADSLHLYLCRLDIFGERRSYVVSCDPEKTFLGSSSSSLSVSQPETYTELDVPSDSSSVALDLGLTAATDVDSALQQILEKLSANELAGTQTVAGSGEGEGEDEESPYLPYIPQIFQKLEALPDTIGNKIHDLFVPSDEFVEALPAQFANIFESRCGLLTYPASLLVDFFTRLSTLTAQEPVFSWGNIYEPFSNTLLIPSGSYNLNSSVQNEAMQRVYSVYLIVVKALVALWFVDLCRRKYNQIIYK